MTLKELKQLSTHRWVTGKDTQMNSALKEAWEQGAKAQREICANHAKVVSDYLPARDNMTYFVERESILSAPLAKLEDL